MADRPLSAGEANRFFAERDAHDAAQARRRNTKAADPPTPPQCGACGSFLPVDAQYAPATCPGCGVTLPVAPKPPKGGRANSPDGKPPRSAKPWRKDSQWLTMISEAMARNVKLAIDAATAPLVARIAELEGHGEARVSMSHRNAAGEVVAEFWERGGTVTLRIDGTKTTEAIAGTPKAAELLAAFEGLAP